MSNWEKYSGTPKEWNLFVEREDNDFRQLYEWGDYKNKLGWSVLRLIYCDEGNIVSSAQVLYKQMPLIGSVYVPGGMSGRLVHLDDSFKDTIKAFLSVRFLYIRLDSPQKELTQDYEHLQSNGFNRPSFLLSSLEYCELDLTMDNETILRDAKEKWRYNHKKSLSKEIILKVETRADYLISINKELCADWNARNTFLEREVVPLISTLGDRLVMCTASDKDGQLVGVRVVVLSGVKAFHLYNAVSKKGRDLIPGYRLLMFTLNVLRDKKVIQLNLGSTNQARFPGPYRFKVGIGYKNSLYTALGEWNYTSNVMLGFVLNKFIDAYFNSTSFMKKIIKNF